MDITDITFRLYTDSDYEPVKLNLIESGQFDSIWDSKENIKDMCTLLAVYDDDIIGSISLSKYGEKTGQLLRLNVKKKNQNNGVGTKLINEGVRIAKDEMGWLEAGLLSMPYKTKFYEKRGWNNQHEFVWMNKKLN